MKQPIISFLKKNGFVRMETNSYANDICNVVFYANRDDDEYGDGYYAVSNNNGDVAYSDDENIYWLIGYLTYHGFINQPYLHP